MYVMGLRLLNFRNHRDLCLEFDSCKPVVICGPNGVGKTSVLEALSLLHPGNGIRSAAVRDIGFKGMDWNATFKAAKGELVDDYTLAYARGRKTLKINGKLVRGYKEVVESFSFAWLNPRVDIMLSEDAEELRRFFDRMVVSLSSIHAEHLIKYDRVRKMRIKILLEEQDNLPLLESLEQIMSQEAVAIATNRNNFLNVLTQKLAEQQDQLPNPKISIVGQVESYIDQGISNGELAAILLEELKRNRGIDLATKRTKTGPHRSKFIVENIDQKLESKLCSTGEQKLLLLKILFALRSAKSVLLLDDINSHIDSAYQREIRRMITESGMQTWITDTDCSGYDPGEFHIANLPQETGNLEDTINDERIIAQAIGK